MATHRAARLTVFGLASALLLQACAGTQSNSPSGGGSPADSDDPSSSAGANEPVTLQLMWYNDGPFWDGVIERFQDEYSWITVEVEGVPGDQYYQKLGAYVQAGEGPDVMQVDGGAIVSSYVDVIDPVTDDVQDLLPTLSGPETYCVNYDCEQGVLGIPYNVQGHPLYYNKTVLEEAGLDPENPPRTWRDMADACEAVQAIDKACWSLGAADIGLLLMIAQMPLRYATVEDMVGLTTGETHWTDPVFINTLRLFEDMRDRGWLQEGFEAATHVPDAMNILANGEAAFFQGLFGDGAHWKAFADIMDIETLGVMNLPTVEDDYPVEGASPGPLNETNAVPAATGMVIPTWSEHRDEALLFARFMVTVENQTQMVQDLGSFAALQDVDTSAITEEVFGQLVELAATSESGSFGTLAGVAYQDIQNAELQRILIGQTTVEAAAEALEQAAIRTRE